MILDFVFEFKPILDEIEPRFEVRFRAGCSVRRLERPTPPITVIDRIQQKRIVPVVVLDDTGAAEPLAEALLAGGLDIIEITFRTPAAEESIRRIASSFPEMLLGAGTLLEEEQVSRAAEAGAPYGHTGAKLIPTGGITVENLAGYLKLPIVAAVGGSWMVERSLIREGRWGEITRLTREALAIAGAAV